MPRVPGSFGQRVSSRKLWDNGLHFLRKRGFRSYFACLSLNGNRKEKTVNSRNGKLKVFEKQEFRLTHHKRNWRKDHCLAVRASEDLLTLSVSVFLVFQRASHRAEYHHASNTIDNFFVLFVETAQMSSTTILCSVILNSFDKTFFRGFRETDVMFSHGTFAIRQ